jgi:hypothetical protein
MELSKSMGARLGAQIGTIDSGLSKYCPDVPISFNSDEQLSAFLYGGVVTEIGLEPYEFHYKDPKKPPVQKYRKVVKSYTLPSIFKPFPNTGLQKDGVFSTDKKTLLRLRFKAEGFST